MRSLRPRSISLRSWTNLQRLYYLGKYKSIRQAAKALDIHYSVLHRHLHSLEIELGETLLAKDQHNNLCLTKAGKYWYQVAAHAIDSVNDLLQQPSDNMPSQAVAGQQHIIIQNQEAYTSQISICIVQYPKPVLDCLQFLCRKTKYKDHKIEQIAVDYDSHHNAHLPEDVDLRVLFGHRHSYYSENFICEIVAESMFSSWATASYIEKHGLPRCLNDLQGHVMTKPDKRSNAVKDIGGFFHPVADSALPRLIAARDWTFYDVADTGLAFLNTTAKTLTFRKHKFEQLPQLCPEQYGYYHLQVHKRSKDNPFVQDFCKTYRKLLRR